MRLPLAMGLWWLLPAALLAQEPESHEHRHAPEAEQPQASEEDGLRDPHAWSDGLVRGAGPHTLEGEEPLQVHDVHAFWQWRVDRLEWADGHADEASLEGSIDYGRTWQGWQLKVDASAADGDDDEHRLELVHRRAIAAFWDLQAGVRHDDFGEASRTWLGLGLQGLAPYWFDVELSAWIGESGRTVLTTEVDYEWLLSQRWVLQPRIELNLYGRDDEASRLGSGLSDAEAGLRLRYEINRQFAPYLGWEWSGLFGGTADQAEASGEPRRDQRWLVGVRFWY